MIPLIQNFDLNQIGIIRIKYIINFHLHQNFICSIINFILIPLSYYHFRIDNFFIHILIFMILGLHRHSIVTTQINYHIH